MQKHLLDINNAAEFLNVHPETLRRWDNSGKLKSVRVGSRGDRRYKLQDLKNFISGKTLVEIVANDLEDSELYIPQRIKTFESFSEADKERELYMDYFPDDEFIESSDPTFSLNRTFLIAEPGYGKTRLLKHICETNGKEEALYIDLKIFAQSGYNDLADFIRKELSIGYDINTPKFVLCLDALDEIKSDLFSLTVERIKKFCKEYSRASIILSSRFFFFKRKLEEFEGFNFNYSILYALSSNKIYEYLEQKGFNTGQIDNLIVLCSYSGRRSLLAIPRYLELIPKYIEKVGIENVSNIERVQLFDQFLYSKLDTEEKKLGKQLSTALRHILEKLALVLEINQTNIISTADFSTFLSDAAGSFISSFGDEVIEVLFERTILKRDGENIEFLNAEFQEFLAAKAITRLNMPEMVFYELAVDPAIREVKPSWIPTLTYLVELLPNLLNAFLDLGEKSDLSLLQTEQYHLLLTGVPVYKLEEQDKTKVFKQVFGYYQKVLHWVSSDVSKNLVRFFLPVHEEILRSYADRKYESFSSETERTVILGNVAHVVGDLLAGNLLSSESSTYWKDKLITYANDANEKGVLQRTALYALETFTEPELIDKVSEVQKHRDSLLRRRFISFCVRTDPNGKTTILNVIDGIKDREYEAYYGIPEIKSLTGITYLLQRMLDDPEFLFAIIHDERDFNSERYTKLVENINNNLTDETLFLLDSIVVTVFSSNKTRYEAEESSFAFELVKILYKGNEEYLEHLISQIAKFEDLRKNLFSFIRIFSTLITVENSQKFIGALKKMDVEHGEYIASSVFIRAGLSERTDAAKIYEVGRTYFPNVYKKLETDRKKTTHNFDRSDEIYENFVKKLEPEKGRYFTDVFSTYLHNKDLIERRWDSKVKERLSSLVLGSVFAHFDPRKQRLTITNSHDGNVTFTTSSAIRYFGDCIRVAKELKLDINDFKSKIIGFIPFAYEELDDIFELVNSITTSEAKELVSVYLEKKDDLWRHNPSNFMAAALKYKLYDSVPILKEFIDEDQFSIYDRTEALKVVGQLENDKSYIRSVFNKYKESVAKLANEAINILITQFEDSEAIQERFTQMKSNAVPFVRPEGGHSVGDVEHELSSKEFSSPLLVLAHPKYEDLFLDLLDYSLNLLNQSTEYYEYASYYWEVIFKYFENRKLERSYTPLKNLESHVYSKFDMEGSNWFLGRLKELKKIYLDFIGRPADFAGSLKEYLKVTSKEFLDIRSHRNLSRFVIDVLNEDVRKYLNAAGGNALIINDETELQKQLMTELQNIFLRKGVDAQFIREAQALDNTRSDFLIWSGVYGPVLIEVKLSSHGDLSGNMKSKTSYKRFLDYKTNYRADYGIFLVIDNKARNSRGMTWDSHLKKIKFYYEDIENTTVVGISPKST